ncbi:Eisosome component PIL1-domain-containing protein, partial [Endogone sp. FLAS-F59071]
KYQQFRATLKSIRTREEALFDSRQKKRDLQLRIQSLVKTSPKSPKVKEFNHELSSLEHDTQELETELADFKRFALREAFYLQFNALFEVSEKTAILAGFGRYIVDQIDVTPSTPGEPRTPYTGGEQTAQVLQDALEAVDGWHAPELDERPTLTQKVGAEAFYTHENNSGENVALSRHPSTRMAQLVQLSAADHATSENDVDVDVAFAPAKPSRSRPHPQVSLARTSSPPPPTPPRPQVSLDSTSSAPPPTPPRSQVSLDSTSSAPPPAPPRSQVSLDSTSSAPPPTPPRPQVSLDSTSSAPSRSETLQSTRAELQRQLSTSSTVSVTISNISSSGAQVTRGTDEAAYDSLPTPPPAYPALQKPSEYQKPGEVEDAPATVITPGPVATISSTIVTAESSSSNISAAPSVAEASPVVETSPAHIEARPVAEASETILTRADSAKVEVVEASETILTRADSAKVEVVETSEANPTRADSSKMELPEDKVELEDTAAGFSETPNLAIPSLFSSPLQAHVHPYQSAVVRTPPQTYATAGSPQPQATGASTYNYGQLYQQAQQIAAPAPRPYSEFQQHFAYAQQQYGSSQQPLAYHPQGPQYSSYQLQNLSQNAPGQQRPDNIGGFAIVGPTQSPALPNRSPIPGQAQAAVPKGDNIGGFVLPQGLSAEEEKKRLAERDVREAAAQSRQQGPQSRHQGPSRQ